MEQYRVPGTGTNGGNGGSCRAANLCQTADMQGGLANNAANTADAKHGKVENVENVAVATVLGSAPE
jgi:hypothetical protein